MTSECSYSSDPELLSIRRCKRCGEIAGSKTSFSPWCVGTQRGHDGETIEVARAALDHPTPTEKEGDADAVESRLADSPLTDAAEGSPLTQGGPSPTERECPVCFGRGRRSTYVNELGREVEAACPDCKGRGTLPAESPGGGE